MANTNRTHRHVALGLIFLSVSAANSQVRQWTRQFGSAGTDEVTATAVASDGVYAAGETFGTIPGGANSGKSDAFLAKFDLQGNPLWSVQFGTAENEGILGLAADASGVYAVGFTNGGLQGNSAGGSDAFVRKYDPNGNALWTRQLGTIGEDAAQAAAVDSTGVYVSGYVFGALPGNTTAGGSDAFIRKYNRDGNELWTRQFGSNSNDEGRGIAVDSSGVYVTGPAGAALVATVGGTDGFLRKYTQEGTVVWTRQFGSTTTDEFNAVAVNRTGVYATGQTTGTFAGQTKVGGLYDAVAIKFDLNGNQQWVRQFGTTNDDYGYGIAAAVHWVYVTGQANSAAAAMWRYDVNGNDTGNIQLGTFASIAQGAAADGNAAYIAGTSSGMQVGPNPIGDADGFVFKVPHPPFLDGISDAFTGLPGVAPTTWMALYGSNLAATTRTWDGAISGTQLPASLDGVSVSINNKPATVYFINPGQVNVLAPLEDSTGPVQVTLTTQYGTSPPLQTTASAVLPAFYAPFGETKGLSVTAVALDGTLLGKPGLDPRVARPVRPGEVVQFFATGFGRTNPLAPSDTVFLGAPEVVTRPRITIGGREAMIIGNGNLVGPGLYQFNLTIPDLADGDHAIVAEIGSARSLSTVFLAVRR